MVHERRLGGQLARAGQPGVIHGQLDQVELIFVVEDREVRLIAEQFRRPAEQAIADMVKRAGPDLIGGLADQRFHAPHHLAGRAAGECDEHDRLGRHAREDQIGHAIGDDPRLARAGAGQNQVVAIGRRYRRALRLVQVALKLRRQPSVQRRIEANDPHLAA